MSENDVSVMQAEAVAVEIVPAMVEEAPRIGRLDRLLAFTEARVAWARTWLPLLLAIGASPALFFWPLLRAPSFDYVAANNLPSPLRVELLLAVIGSVVLVSGIYLVYGRRKARSGGWPFAVSARHLNGRLLGLLALPLIPPLATPKIDSAKPWLALALAAGIAVISAAAAYRWVPAGRRAGRAWIPAAFAAGLAIAYAITFSVFAITQHHALKTAIFDLGIYDSIFWHSIHGEPLGASFVRTGSHVAAHVDPILVLLSPLYLLYPRAELLLVLQSVWLASGAIPLFLIGRRALGPWQGLAFAAIYLLHPALHGANMYDFHSLSLAAPLLIWAIACIEHGWLKSYGVVLGLLLLTREDLSLLACFLGLYAIASRKAPKAGIATIGISIAYLAFVKLFVMPDPGLLMKNSKEAYGYAYYYKDLIPYGGEGTAGLLLSLITNPAFSFAHVLQEAKVLFFLKLFLPVLFLPFLAPRGKLMMVYGFAFLFLASRDAVFSTHFQYSTVLYPIALSLAPIALASLDRFRLVGFFRLDAVRLAPALVVGMLAASAAVSAKFGALLPTDSFRAGFARFDRNPTQETREAYAWVSEAVKQIPPRASVSATSKLGSHVSGRDEAHVFPGGAGSDYLLLERSAVKGPDRDWLKRLEQSGAYEPVTSRKQLVLLRRNAAVPLPDKDAKEPAKKEPVRPKAIGAPVQPAGGGSSLAPERPSLAPLRNRLLQRNGEGAIPSSPPR